jgi:hypothetical protein
MSRSARQRILDTVVAMLQGIGASAYTDLGTATRPRDQRDEDSSPIEVP